MPTQNHKIRSAYIKITLYFLGIFILFFTILKINPDSRGFLPIGTAEKMFSTPEFQEIETSVHAGRLDEDSVSQRAIFFSMCFISAILMALPIGTTFLATARPKRSSISIAKMIIGLPIVVTGLVLIVQNSLALAFSLAGIVAGAGIRFRTNLREFTDTLYFLISIGIGLSTGIGALGISYIMSVVFCYAVLTLQALDYGNPQWMKDEIESARQEELKKVDAE